MAVCMWHVWMDLYNMCHLIVKVIKLSLQNQSTCRKTLALFIDLCVMTVNTYYFLNTRWCFDRFNVSHTVNTTVNKHEFWKCILYYKMYFKNKCVGCQTVSFFTTSLDIKFYYILSKYVGWNNPPHAPPTSLLWLFVNKHD
jgi:uncharacterized paraquat-inducible protein A